MDRGIAQQTDVNDAQVSARQSDAPQLVARALTPSMRLRGNKDRQLSETNMVNLYLNNVMSRYQRFGRNRRRTLWCRNIFGDS